MPHVTSADGTTIEVTDTASAGGPVVVIVSGAFSRAADAAPLAEALTAQGLRAVTYDRRARGDSGHTPPVDPLREVDDLAAFIDASGGHASVLGHSSGAVLALYAASLGVPIAHLFLSEPPFRFGQGAPASDLPERLQRAVDDGRPEEAIVTFQREGIGLDEATIEHLRSSPVFADLVGLAQSTVYDATLTRDVSTPTEGMRTVSAPVTILCGVQTFPFLVASARRLAEAIAHAELVEVPESVGHRPDPVATALIVAERAK